MLRICPRSMEAKRERGLCFSSVSEAVMRAILM
jgi:hypothetical protein